MSSDVVLEVSGLSKCYHLYESPLHRLEQFFFRGRRQLYREFWALQDVGFTLRKGEGVSIIGRNGAGKSTLLQIIAGTLAPTSGAVRTDGRIAALLELGSGFNPLFTGRQNVFLNGAILGLSRKEVEARFDEIVDFAQIGDFMEQPVSTYSSGMAVRLAFSVQVCVRPELLIVDEALSVGDIFFQQKCHSRMRKMLDEGMALLLVTHDMAAVERYSSRVVLLENGVCTFTGDPAEGVRRFYASGRAAGGAVRSGATGGGASDAGDVPSAVDRAEPWKVVQWPDESANVDLAAARSIGPASEARCLRVAVCDEEGKAKRVFEVGSSAVFFYEFLILEPIEVPLVGVTIIDRQGVSVHGKSSVHLGVDAGRPAVRGSVLRVRQSMKLDVVPGTYTFTVVLGAMSAEDYAHREEMTSAELDGKMRRVNEVLDVGSFFVHEHAAGHGVALPFVGHFDLAGNCTMELGEHLAGADEIVSASRESRAKGVTGLGLTHEALAR